MPIQANFRVAASTVVQMEFVYAKSLTAALVLANEKIRVFEEKYVYSIKLN